MLLPEPTNRTMKRLLPLWLAGILIVSGGCDSTTSSDHEGTLVGRLDGETWRGSAELDLVGDTMTLWSIRGSGGGQEGLVLRIVETGPGAFTLVTPDMSGYPSRYEVTVGGDVLSYTAPVTAGTIQVDEFDRGSGRMLGTLELTITGTRGTWRFEDGEFETRNIRDPYER